LLTIWAEVKAVGAAATQARAHDDRVVLRGRNVGNLRPAGYNHAQTGVTSAALSGYGYYPGFVCFQIQYNPQTRHMITVSTKLQAAVWADSHQWGHDKKPASTMG
jgi:hypothetical protein